MSGNQFTSPEANCKNIAILIVSCDNYADLWEPFFTLFNRFWSDCPFSVYLVSNHKQYSSSRVMTITVGEDISWSDNLKRALELIPEEFVLLWIDDLFLLKPVASDRLMNICTAFQQVNGNYIRLNPTINADVPFNELFGLVSPGTIYRCSTVLSLWRKSVLDNLVNTGESAWDFEIFGTVRSDKYDGFYATHTAIFPVENGVIKGKWRNRVYKSISALCPNANLTRRNRMNLLEEICLLAKTVRSRVLNLLPAGSRRHIKEFMLGGKYDYRLAKNVEGNK